MSEMIENQAWNRIFGTAWDTILKYEKRTGAFLVDVENNQILFDQNIMNILEMDPNSLSAKAFLEMLEKVEGDMKVHSPLKVHFVEHDEHGISAGIIHAVDEIERSLNDIYPLESQANLVHHMTSDPKGDSLLAFIRLEGVEQDAFAEAKICSAMNAIVQFLPSDALVAANSHLQFWLFVPGLNNIQGQYRLLGELQDVVKKCRITDEFGVELMPIHGMTLTCGTAGISVLPIERMHTANHSLYEAIIEGPGHISLFSQEHYENQDGSFQEMKRFITLLDENRFIYHFQPIVSAENGEIVAYEALMRTDASINLYPNRILELAEKTGRLYDIERATFFNTMSFLNEHQSAFENRKLFVNSISGHSLSEEDFSQLCDTYGELMEKMVMELTEQSELRDVDLTQIQERLRNAHVQLAIDDYGTGYSNTANLLRYNPAIVKIDRELISGIDSNARVRKVVETVIAFLHDSGYMALAEGVETSAELQTMINLGADLIQGYYTSKPRAVLLNEISASIREEIVRYNKSLGDRHLKIYRPMNQEVVVLENLAKEKYTDIYISEEEVTFVGRADEIYSLAVSFRDSTKCKLTLKNAGLRSLTDQATIRLGNDCQVDLICEGNNRLEGKGIYVPQKSFLDLKGSGKISIRAELLHCYGIGTSMDEACGTIDINLFGELDVYVNGDVCVGIGGGKNGIGSIVRIFSGSVNVTASGRRCLGIGIYEGNSNVYVENAQVKIETSAPDCVGLGTFDGDLNLYMRHFKLEIEGSGHMLVGVGCPQEGKGLLDLEEGTVAVGLRGREIIAIGTNRGHIDHDYAKVGLEISCQGDHITALGDPEGGGDILFRDVKGVLRCDTGDYHPVGAKEGSFAMVGGSLEEHINE